jgi:hypothetical protein
LSIYGSPVLQAAVGIDPGSDKPLRRAAKSSLYRKLLDERIAELRSHIRTGGVRECLARGLIYIGMARGGPDERGFAAIRRLRVSEGDRSRLTLSEFKNFIREQYFMLLIDETATLGAIPELLPADPAARHKAFDRLCQILSARGEIAGEAAERLQKVARLFGSEVDPALVPAHARKIKLAKAS